MVQFKPFLTEKYEIISLKNNKQITQNKKKKIVEKNRSKKCRLASIFCSLQYFLR